MKKSCVFFYFSKNLKVISLILLRNYSQLSSAFFEFLRTCGFCDGGPEGLATSGYPETDNICGRLYATGTGESEKWMVRDNR